MDIALALSDLIPKGFWEKFVESCEAIGGRGSRRGGRGSEYLILRSGRQWRSSVPAFILALGHPIIDSTGHPGRTEWRSSGEGHVGDSFILELTQSFSDYF